MGKREIDNNGNKPEINKIIMLKKKGKRNNRPKKKIEIDNNGKKGKCILMDKREIDNNGRK